MNNTELLKSLAEQYHLEVDGITFWTPYYIAPLPTPEQPKPAPSPFKGKGTPEQITQYLLDSLRDHSKRPSTPEEYRSYMADGLHLGIECSGFAYHLLDGFLRQIKGEALQDHLYKSREQMLAVYDNPLLTPPAGLTRETVAAYPDQVSLAKIQQDWGNDPRRIADVVVLSSELASDTVERVSDIRPADMVAMLGQDQVPHILVVMAVEGKVIHYVHSSGRHGRTDVYGGVEYGEIHIIYPDLPLAEQGWRGAAVREHHPKGYDVVKRLKVLANA
jgi:hypothetical protein